MRWLLDGCNQILRKKSEKETTIPKDRYIWFWDNIENSDIPNES